MSDPNIEHYQAFLAYDFENDARFQVDKMFASILMCILSMYLGWFKSFIEGIDGC
jgi:hypothetical protein